MNNQTQKNKNLQKKKKPKIFSPCLITNIKTKTFIIKANNIWKLLTG